MTANPAGSKLGAFTLGRRHAMRACLTIAVFVLVLATLGAAAARADEPVDPAATTSAEPTPDATSTEPTPDATSTEEPNVVPESPSPEEPGEGDSGPIGGGTGSGGEGGEAATSTADEVVGTEQAPVVEGPLAAVAEDARDPRASIGDIDCTNLTVPVTLDNSRSTEGVSYLIFAGDADGDGPTFEKTVSGPAGESRIMSLSVTEDTRFAVYVYEQSGRFLPDRILAFAVVTVDCTADNDAHDPQARIGGLDCAQLTLDVTLDNRKSEDETTYLVTAINLPDEVPIYEQMFTVPSGHMQTIPVPVTENSTVGVIVGDKDVLDETEGEEGNLALELFRVDCTPGDEPRASIGEVDCTNLTVPLFLDNTTSAGRTTFVVMAFAPESDEFFEHEEYFVVAARAERSVVAPLLDHANVVVVAADGDKFYLGDAFAYETFDVDCVRVSAGRFGPPLTVGDGALAATGANGLTLPTAGLTLLACGGVLSMLGRRHT